MNLLLNIYLICVFFFLTYTIFILVMSLPSYNKKPNIPIFNDNIDPNLFYYIFIPCADEEKVIKNTITKLLDMSFSGVAVVIDDASEDGTREEIASVKSDRLVVIERKHPNARQGKGAALNMALRYAIEDAESKGLNFNNVVIGVIDADGHLSCNSFEVLGKCFWDDTISAAQMRIKMKQPFSSFMQCVQDAEFFAINNHIQVSRRFSKSVGLSGNGQFFRLSHILQHVGDSPWGTALLDDYELTLKMMLSNLKIEYISEAYAYQEALISVRRFIRQRSRWVQGALDCWRYAPDVLRSHKIDRYQKLDIFYFLTQPIINIVSNFSVAGLFVFLMYMVIQNFSLAYMLVLIGAFIGSTLLGVFFTIDYMYLLKSNNECSLAKHHILVLPILISYIYLLLWVSIMIALFRFFTNQKAWLKTDRN